MKIIPALTESRLDAKATLAIDLPSDTAKDGVAHVHENDRHLEVSSKPMAHDLAPQHRRHDA